MAGKKKTALKPMTFSEALSSPPKHTERLLSPPEIELNCSGQVNHIAIIFPNLSMPIIFPNYGSLDNTLIFWSLTSMILDEMLTALSSVGELQQMSLPIQGGREMPCFQRCIQHTSAHNRQGARETRVLSSCNELRHGMH